MGALGRKRILFITTWEYADGLVQSATLPHIEIINANNSYYSCLVTTSKSVKKISVKKRGSITLVEVPVSGAFLFSQWLLNIFALRTIVKKKNTMFIHAWCPPAGAIGAVLKIFRKKATFVIDSFEPHAEAMVENGTWSKSGVKYRVLSFMEKKQARMADYLICSASGMEEYLSNRYKIRVTNCFVKPACVNLQLFSANSSKSRELLLKLDLMDKITCVYAGKFGGIYLEDETFKFIKKCEEYWGSNKFRFLLLSNVSDEYLSNQVAKHSINSQSIIKLLVPHREVPKYIGLADFAICPVKPVPTKRYCSPIKNGEYWAMGLPIVITPNISIDSDIIKQNNIGAIIESFDYAGYLNAIRQIDDILKNMGREDIYNIVRPIAEKYRNFKIAENIYAKIYHA